MGTKGVIMIIAAVAVAAGTYFGLEAAFPPPEPDPDSGPLVSVEEIFAGRVAVADTGAASTEDATGKLAAQDFAPPDAGTMNATELVDAESRMPSPAPDNPTAAPMPEPEPAPEPTPEPSPVPTPKPTPEPTAKAAKAAPPAPAGLPTPRPTAGKSPPPKLTQWWGPESPAHLSIIYAGSAAYTRAIVLMFNGAFDDASSADRNLSVTGPGGKAMQGRWQVGANNKRMLLFPVDRPGIYTVSVQPELSDRNGRKLGKRLSGPVQVR